MRSEENIIEVSHLTKKYRNFTLRDISFTLEKGYIMGLIGRNGAGKTTLMNCILGTVARDAGTIMVAGYPYKTHSLEARNEIGFLVEPAPFHFDRSLAENGVMFGQLYSNWDAELFGQLLIQYGLDRNQAVGELSKGMQTRFQLAFALAHKPKLLIMDEPTGGLDPVFRREFLEIIQKEVRDRMISAIISTHLTGDLDKIADYILLIDQGEKVLYLDKEQLMDEYLLLTGEREDILSIPENIRGRVRKKGAYESTILRYPRYLADHPELKKRLHAERTNLEEMMYYLTKSAFVEREN